MNCLSHVSGALHTRAVDFENWRKLLLFLVIVVVNCIARRLAAAPWLTARTRHKNVFSLLHSEKANLLFVLHLLQLAELSYHLGIKKFFQGVCVNLVLAKTVTKKLFYLIEITCSSLSGCIKITLPALAVPNKFLVIPIEEDFNFCDNISVVNDCLVDVAYLSFHFDHPFSEFFFSLYGLLLEGFFCNDKVVIKLVSHVGHLN